MTPEKVTPIHRAIDAVDETITQLKNQRAALVALLPDQPKARNVKAIDPRTLWGGRRAD